ncbi:amidohydrolase [Corynebacterium lubricantis]|uniref:amidohydrolase n=1 Tax=Corynebacterium lubricantis TaxID=541095 RepID=UPI00038162AD|nr:amidohydrolase [Corynebacterium lubricantis]
MGNQAVTKILSDLDSTRAEREELLKHFHQHPELSLQEYETSARIRAELEAAGIEVHSVGKTGLVAIVENGEGPVVAMRGDIDALPVKEVSGKDYASTAEQEDEKTGQTFAVSHACGHDFHIMSLLSALKFYNSHKDAWAGTYVGVFQPAEEIAAGAQEMVDAGIAEVMPKPDVYLGQHVIAVTPGGTVASKPGTIFTAASSIRVKVYGKGSHGSMPQLSVDPVVLASAIVTRLQTIVGREIAPNDMGVVTVGAIHAGTKSNIIPDDAELLINTRAYDKDVEAHMHEAIERIVRAECEAARSPKEPEFEYYDIYPLTSNHQEPFEQVRAVFDDFFGDDSVDIDPVSASEDFSIVPDSMDVPYVYWCVGGFEDWKNAPGNHNPAFAPDLQPTLDRGVEAAVVAASAWLVKNEDA